MAWTWFHRLGSPPYIYGLAARLTPWFAWLAAVLIIGGLYGGLVLAPPDYQQGDDFRIIYVHAPSAWMSLMVYSTMAISAGVGLIWRIKIAHAVAAGCAPIGASFTLLARDFFRTFFRCVFTVLSDIFSFAAICFPENPLMRSFNIFSSAGVKGEAE